MKNQSRRVVVKLLLLLLPAWFDSLDCFVSKSVRVNNSQLASWWNFHDKKTCYTCTNRVLQWYTISDEMSTKSFVESLRFGTSNSGSKCYKSRMERTHFFGAFFCETFKPEESSLGHILSNMTQIVFLLLGWSSYGRKAVAILVPHKINEKGQKNKIFFRKC